MFKGFMLSESLEDPLFLNQFAHEYVQIQHRDDAEVAAGYPRFWHLFKVLVDDEQIERIVQETARLLKGTGWYAHYWNGQVVYVCFPGRVFQVPQEQRGAWSSAEFFEVRNHALRCGIAERYLDFLVEP
jgi:hypothetical protein